jgi:hypothetical protein
MPLGLGLPAQASEAPLNGALRARFDFQIVYFSECGHGSRVTHVDQNVYLG